MPAYGYYSRSSIENSPLEERPTVPAIIRERFPGGCFADRYVGAQITIDPGSSDIRLSAENNGRIFERIISWQSALDSINGNGNWTDRILLNPKLSEVFS